MKSNQETMRNKSEALPALPPPYSWRVINGQEQAWFRGSPQFWVHPGADLDAVVTKCWAKWSQDSGLTEERYLNLLRCERLARAI